MGRCHPLSQIWACGLSHPSGYSHLPKLNDDILIKEHPVQMGKRGWMSLKVSRQFSGLVSLMCPGLLVQCSQAPKHHQVGSQCKSSFSTTSLIPLCNENKTFNPLPDPVLDFVTIRFPVSSWIRDRGFKGPFHFLGGEAVFPKRWGEKFTSAVNIPQSRCLFGLGPWGWAVWQFGSLTNLKNRFFWVRITPKSLIWGIVGHHVFVGKEITNQQDDSKLFD